MGALLEVHVVREGVHPRAMQRDAEDDLPQHVNVAAASSDREPHLFLGVH